MPKKKQPQHGGTRPGAGRPKIYKHLAQPTSVTLETDMLKRLDKRAASLGLTRSAAIKLAVGEWLK
jgi:hypothetical protein